MKIQSLSVVVPPVGGGKCINDCRFCVAKMKPAQFVNQIEGNLRFYDLYRRQYIERAGLCPRQWLQYSDAYRRL